jgi:hypothetical protein
MREYNRNQKLFSLHIPKCGGTSFTNVLIKWFWPGFHAHYFTHATNEMPRKIRLFKRVLEGLGMFPMCIHGHFEEEAGVYETYPDAKQFITIIRDPLEMQVSMFFDHKRRLNNPDEGLFWKGEKMEMEYEGDINTWVQERPFYLLKFFPWEITLDNYINVINEHFVHIGITENLEKSIRFFAQKLNKKPESVEHLNKSPRHEGLMEESIQIFKSKHKLEYAIYDYVKTLNS